MYTELNTRLDELKNQYFKVREEVKSPDRGEMLRELEIEIRQVQDGIRAAQMAMAQRGIELPSANNVNKGQEPQICQLPSGFIAREITAQLAGAWKTPKSVYVYDVMKGSPAEAAGLLVRDVIVGSQQEPLTCTQLKTIFSRTQTPVTLTVIRNEQKIQLTIKTQ